MAADDLLVEIYPIEDQSGKIIKVIGVGGGGGNAVKNMYEEHPEGVRFAVCNTDSQALSSCNVPVRIMLGEDGLGVGGKPEVGRAAAEKSLDATAKLFEDETRMVFITAGMGGGTGTGASPIIAKQARERGILTIGVVTLPFAFERRRSIEKALCGLSELRKNVDAILVINNERLLDIYTNTETTATDAFKFADNILSHATLSIAEIITTEGIINCDFCDVQSTMKDGGASVISVGRATGEGRIFRAVEDALNSPLLTGIKIENTKKLLCVVYTGDVSPVKITELNDLEDFMDTVSDDVEFILGLYPDHSLGDEVKVSLIASGFDDEFPADIDQLREKYYGTTKRAGGKKSAAAPETVVEQPAEVPAEELAAEPAETPAPSAVAEKPASQPHAPQPTWLDRFTSKLAELFEDNA